MPDRHRRREPMAVVKTLYSDGSSPVKEQQLLGNDLAKPRSWIWQQGSECGTTHRFSDFRETTAGVDHVTQTSCWLAGGVQTLGMVESGRPIGRTNRPCRNADHSRAGV